MVKKIKSLQIAPSENSRKPPITPRSFPNHPSILSIHHKPRKIPSLQSLLPLIVLLRLLLHNLNMLIVLRNLLQALSRSVVHNEVERWTGLLDTDVLLGKTSLGLDEIERGFAGFDFLLGGELVRAVFGILPVLFLQIVISRISTN